MAPAPRWPAPLRPGDKVRFLSPASPPEPAGVLCRAAMLRDWGLEVDFGAAAFNRAGYLAGTDDERLADINAAIADPAVRAIIATRGGKGSYRIADRLDFAGLRADPKFLVGFSDIAVLLAACVRHCDLVGIHGALIGDDDRIEPASAASLRRLLMSGGETVIAASPAEATWALTTPGLARGRLVGGHLETIAAGAGWALPRLTGMILLLEAVNMGIGQVDRLLTMLRKAGHLDGIAGVALGQFIGFEPIIGEVLAGHLAPLGVPVLGGLPLGHGNSSLCVPIGAGAVLDADRRQLIVG